MDRDLPAFESIGINQEALYPKDPFPGQDDRFYYFLCKYVVKTGYIITHERKLM